MGRVFRLKISIESSILSIESMGIAIGPVVVLGWDFPLRVELWSFTRVISGRGIRVRD